MTDSAERTLQSRLADAIAEVTGHERKLCEEAAFHLTDWQDELFALNELYRDPEKYSREEQYRIIQRFLIHATEHSIAASEILLGYTPENIFKKDDAGTS